MIDNLNKYGILSLSVRSADFLCQTSPLVCAVELYRSPDRRRNRAFLLEEKMPKGIQGFQKGHKGFRIKESYDGLREKMKGNKFALGSHYQHTEEAKIKIGLAHKGDKNFFYGKHLSKERKLKQGLSMKRFILGNKDFGFQKGHLPWNTGKKRPEISKEKNWNWKGGRKKDHRGYILIYSPGHPYSAYANYVYEHRIVIEGQIGRYLLSTEIVHHLGAKDDNIPKKLVAFVSNSAHQRFEHNPNNVKPEEIIFDGRKIK